ncbi:RNA exonuclease 4 [Anthophora quadrimaculata]
MANVNSRIFFDYSSIIISLVLAVFFIIVIFFTRKNKEQGKQCHSKKSSTKKSMDEKSRKNTQRMTPHTERNASGRNWEIFKNLVFNVPPLNSDASGKENIKKKSSPPQKSRKKYHPSVVNGDHVPSIIEEEVFDENKKKLTKQVAMDCEMVGIGDGTESMIARVSIVNRHGFCVYDKYVKPREPVQDYRTEVSGIRPHNLQDGEDFEIVQKEVSDILKSRILVGHALKHDLDVLYLSHPRKHLRDTSRFKTFRKLSRGNTPSLKKLTHELLGREIQTGEHNSIEDARAAMQLYMLYRNKWELEFYSKR